MQESEEFKITAANLKKLGQAKLTRQERKIRQRALDKLGVPDFRQFWLQKAAETELTSMLNKFVNDVCSFLHFE